MIAETNQIGERMKRLSMVLRQVTIALISTVILVGVSLAQETEDSILRANQAKESFNLGLKAQNSGDSAGAITYYNSAINTDENMPDPYLNLGSILFAMKSYKTASEKFKKFTELDPENPVGFMNYGKSLAALAKYDDAADAFKMALEKDKTAIEAEKELGKLYYKQKKYNESISALERYLAVDSTEDYSYYLCGMAHKKKKNYNKAASSFKKAIDINPRHFESLYNLGNVYLTQERFSSAGDNFEKALKIKSKHYRCAYNLAVAIESNDPEDLAGSIAAWEKFIQIARKNPKARKLLKTSQGHLKELKEAKIISEE